MNRLYLKDIAQILKLSKTTVSLVLNGKGDENKISLKTQKRVLDFANSINYMPNQLARGLSRGITETIGLIIPNISDNFYSTIAGCIEKRAKEFNYSVVFSSSNEDPVDESKLIYGMLNRKVDGLIIASTQKNQKDIDALRRMNFPFVLIDRHYPEIDTDYVIVDNYGGVRSIANHLIGLGRRNLGFITLESDLEALNLRLKGFQDTLAEKKMVSHFVKKLNSDDLNEEMKYAIREMVQLSNRPDAIIFSTHYLTSLGLRELRKNNIKIPDDIAIVSFDELSAFDLVEPPITSLIQPVNKIGNTAVEIVVDVINKRKSTINRNVVLKTELMIRKSCGTN